MKERLKSILEQLDLTSAEFADRLGVQRSSVSHILSGRNYPGFEFIQKIIRYYPQISPDWLIMGEGIMWREKPGLNSLKEVPGTEMFPEPQQTLAIKDEESGPYRVSPKFKKKPEEEKLAPDIEHPVEPGLEKIVLFYTDGTFRVFHPG